MISRIYAHRIKTSLIQSLPVLLFITIQLSAGAATITSNVVTNASWGDASTWVGGVVPTSADDVIIATGASVIIRTGFTPASPATCNSITINGTLILGSGSSTKRALSVSTFLLINLGGLLTNDGTESHELTIGGDWTNLGTFTPFVDITTDQGTIAVTFSGTTNQAIDGIASQTFQSFIVNKASGALQNTSNVNSLSTSSLTLTAGTFNVETTLATGNLLLSSGALNIAGNLSVSGNFTNNGGTVSGSTGTVIFNGATQTIGGTAATSFNHIAISANSSVTTDNHITATNVSIADAATLTIGGYNFTTNGSTTIGAGNSGNLTFASTVGTKTFGGLVTVNAGATWNNNINENVYFHNGLINNGNFTPGTGSYNFDVNSQSITGAFNLTSVSVAAGITLTNNGNLTISGALSGAGTLQQAANSTLTAGGTHSISGLIATAVPNTVSFSGTGNPIATNYSNLSLSGTGTKNILAGTTTISGNLSLSGSITTSYSSALIIGGNLSIGDGVTFSVPGFDLIVHGTTTVGEGVSGVINFPSSVGSKSFVGLVTVSAGADWNNSTNNESMVFRGGITNSGTFQSGTNNQTFDTNNQTLTGDLTMPKVVVNGITLTVSDDLIIQNSLSGTGSITLEPNAFVDLQGSAVLASFSANGSGGLVQYSYAAPSLIQGVYGNLTLNQSSGTAALVGATTVKGELKLLNGNLNLGANTLTLGESATLTIATPSVTSMIIASGGGEIKKQVNSTGSFLFPIGELTATPEYSPVTVNLTGASGFTNAYISASVTDAKHASNNSPANFLSRYWNIGASGIVDATATITGTYMSIDINGAEGSISSAQLDGNLNVVSNPWKKGDVLTGNTLTYVGATLTSGQVSAFSGISAAAPTVSITGGGVTICANTSVNLGSTATGDPALTYLWSPATGLGSPNLSSTTATVSTTTNYTLTVYDANGISAMDNTTITTQGPIIAANPVAICEGATGTLTASGAISYTWSPATNLSATTGASVNANPTITTVYTVTGTDVNACQSSKQVTVTVNPKPTVTVNSPIVCSSTPVSLSATGASTYQWSPSIGLSSSAGNPVTATISTTSTYTVTGTDVNNCTNTATATVTVIPAPDKPVITGANLNGAVPRLTSSSTTGNQWYKDGTIINGATSQNLDINEGGSYTVIVANGNCVGPTSDPFVVVITGLNDEQEGIKLYPNPAFDVIKIEWAGFSPDQTIEVRIMDMLGRVMLTQTMTIQDASLNVRSLAKGQHILQVSQSNRNHRIRFTKE